MNKAEPNNSQPNLSDALIKLLLKEINPELSLEHLKDLINVLLDSLEKNKLELDISKVNPADKIYASGWPEEHKKVLIKSGLLEGNKAPIVLEGNNLSLRRWHFEMRQVIDNLLKRNPSTKISEDRSKVCKDIIQEKLNKDQLSAVKAIINHGIILVSGGPGTGKTYTIIQMLIQALNMRPDLNIGLAAPTGKATRRLKDTLLKNIKNIQQPYKEKLEQITCSTLHSWLEARPGGFGKNKNSPLRLDLLIIDEMSMVDLSLMQALLEALPSHTQLVLVGDPNQLPPVSCGAVWEQLQSDSVLKNFGQGAVHLHKLYRNRGKLASLAKVIKEGEFETFWLKVLEQDLTSNVVSQLANSSSIPEKVLNHLKEHKERLKRLSIEFETEKENSTNLKNYHNKKLLEVSVKIFNSLENFMVLSPKTNGLWGVNNLNKVLLEQNFEEGIMKWPSGTPVMCSQNQPELGLSNGDIGVAIGNSQNRRILFRTFSSKEEFAINVIHPARIKKIIPAFALTIHKAQGSEANKVILLWPNSIKNHSSSNTQFDSNEEFDKRLIYTAITRAKEKLEIIINMD